MVSRALGFVTATLLVFASGGTARAVGGQTFGVANDIPTNLYTLVATGVLSAMIFPHIMRSIQQKAPRELDRLITVCVAAAVLVTVVAILAAPLIIRVYAPNWPAAWTELGVLMAYLCMPQLFFFIIYAVIGQVLNAHERYWPFAWAPVISNLVAIAGIIVFLAVTGGAVGDIGEWSTGMAVMLCLSTTAAAGTQTILVVVALRGVGYRYRPRWSIAGLGHLGRTGSWMFGGAMIGQLAFVFVSIAATAAGAALNEANQDGASLNSYALALMVFLVPHGVFTVSIVTEQFTRLSRDVEAGEVSQVGIEVDRGLLIVATISAVFTAGFVVFGPAVAGLIWDAPVIGVVLAWLAPGLLPFSQIYLLNRASMALRDPRAVFLTQATVAVVTGGGAILSGAILDPALVVPAIAGATTVAQFAGWLVAFVLLRRRLHRDHVPGPSWVAAAGSLARLVVAGVVAAVGVLMVQS